MYIRQDVPGGRSKKDKVKEEEKNQNQRHPLSWGRKVLTSMWGHLTEV